MKYLTSYKLFESVGQDIEEMLIEINDELYWKAKCWSEKYGWIVKIEPFQSLHKWELEGQTLPPIVVETIERLIDYMAQNDFDKYRITYEEEYNDEVAEVSIEEVSKLDIWSNQFIRVEFWNDQWFFATFRTNVMKHLKTYESYENSDEFYKDLTDSLFFEINDYFTEDKKRFFPLNIKIAKNTNGTWYGGSVCMAPGWRARMNDEEEEWIFNLIKGYKKQYGISYFCCADSYSDEDFYERKNAAWPENTMDVINFPENPFPERLD